MKLICIRCSFKNFYNDKLNYWSVKDFILIKDKYRESDKKLRSNIVFFSKIFNVEIKLCLDKRVVLMIILVLDCVMVNIFV